MAALLTIACSAVDVVFAFAKANYLQLHKITIEFKEASAYGKEE
ncbi:hypothetical protein [Nonlabens marinus]|uniref:Uncharacterized protein n=1 Tax=Nonlabens marinus S1-08 TaxID=1454201 RepID=W8VNQ9_9FLAO|nr:hypothetical protein [Nonlabens marinus]BAO54020.1 hypothetical protein NMS_0011 [Nonlabens marinus S1-08]